MKSFKDFLEEEELNEVDSLATRMKKRAAFRKNKAKILMKRKRAMKKAQMNPEKLKTKAEKQARNILIKRILKDKSKADLSLGGKAELEKRLEKKKSFIKKLAKRLLPSVKAKELEKTQSKDKGEE